MLVWTNGDGAVDRAVDVRFRGEVQDHVGLRLGDDRRHARAVADVGALEAIARVGRDAASDVSVPA